MQILINSANGYHWNLPYFIGYFHSQSIKKNLYKSDSVLFLDERINFNPNFIIHIVDLNKPVVTCLYGEQLNIFKEKYAYSQEEIKMCRKPFKVEQAKAGCMLVKKEVLQNLKGIDIDKISKDTTELSQKIREAGYDIFAEPRIYFYKK